MHCQDAKRDFQGAKEKGQVAALSEDPSIYRFHCHSARGEKRFG
jgi:hypothetical protein